MTQRVVSDREEFAAVLRDVFGITVAGERLERLWAQAVEPARDVPGTLVKVATHPGDFHADDVFAVAVLGLVHGPLDVVRTRDVAVLAAADVRVDVGGRSDPASGDFDHHQRGGAGERENGIRYASFGLVWKAYGARLAGEGAEAIDARLVQGVDANDTGQTIATALVPGIRHMSVSGVIAAMNPVWDEELPADEQDARFAEAVAFATGVLERELAGSGPTGGRSAWSPPRSRARTTRGSSSSSASCRGTRRS